MLGGKLVASMVKHNKIDKADQELDIAKQRMEEVAYYLKDRKDLVEVDLDISGVLSFADTFFDNFLFDMIVQGRIKDARKQVQSAISLMEGVLDALSEIEAEGILV